MLNNSPPTHTDNAHRYAHAHTRHDEIRQSPLQVHLPCLLVPCLSFCWLHSAGSNEKLIHCVWEWKHSTGWRMLKSQYRCTQLSFHVSTNQTNMAPIKTLIYFNTNSMFESEQRPLVEMAFNGFKSELSFFTGVKTLYFANFFTKINGMSTIFRHHWLLCALKMSPGDMPSVTHYHHKSTVLFISHYLFRPEIE